MSNRSNAIAAAGFLFIGIILVIIGGFMGFERGVIQEGQYNLVVGDWAKNAQDAPTFQQSITFLQKFNDSMNKEGLTSDQYNTPWSWARTPQNSMVFQYSYVGQMIARANFYINYTSTQRAGQLSDVYNQAITNFRAEMDHNGPLDWVAHDAWMLKNGYYWTYYYAAPLIIGGLAMAAIGVLAYGAYGDDK